MDQKRVFLSAVSSEFRAAREAIARVLTGEGFLVREQSSFSLNPDEPTLLGKLDAYIRHCDVVVCLLGSASGYVPPDAAAAAFLHLLPKDVSGIGWSYTQWEGFFAAHYHRRIVRILAAESYIPGPPDAQQAPHTGAYDWSDPSFPCQGAGELRTPSRRDGPRRGGDRGRDSGRNTQGNTRVG